MQNLLLVEDSPTQLQAIIAALSNCKQRFNITTASSLNEAKAILEQIRPDIAIIDLHLPDGKGTDLLSGTDDDMTFPCIILTGEGSEEEAVAALKLGAIDYIVKSVATLNNLPKIIDGTLRHWQRILEIRKKQRELSVHEESYRNFSRQFKSLFNAINDPILMLDPELAIVWANRSANELFTSSDETLSGKLYQNVVEENSLQQVECDSRLATPDLSETCRVRIGRHLYEQKVFPMLDDTSSQLVNAALIFRNITDETEKQERKLHASKLELLGELAAGVAHEINNPINGVINYADILSRSNFEPTRSKDICQRIIGEGERIAKIVKSLLNFSRNNTGQGSTRANVAIVIEEALLLSQLQLKKSSIFVEKDCNEQLSDIAFDPQQLLQILLNLISNSHHALQKKFPESHPDKKIRISCLRKKEFVQLLIEDFGVGIPTKIIPRITESFFTTKPTGEGTGLGLSICRQLVQENGGELKIESRAGEYTKVTINLPTLENPSRQT